MTIDISPTPTTDLPSGTNLLDGYVGAGSTPSAAGVIDEFVDAQGRPRAHWAHITGALDTLGPSELRRRQDDVRRLLEADGASYRIADSGRSQAWELDAIPLLLPSAEWATIEAGVIQRAVLLDLVLRDLYGPRKLLARGLLPPELVFDHPGFLLPCDGLSLPDQSQLFTYALDIARDDDGRFRVLADFAQAPSGAGYALVNRVVLSRVFPSLYRDAQVHHVAPYFRSLRAGLQSLGAHRSDDPRIVVLTPGARSETAFEHAYLASYLGYSLVEGADLVVRDGAVFLRALGHLEPVDVILRRVDAGYCDPLELRPDSQLGVPGLLEACRRGNVVVVNTIGSGAIENPALNAFLPAVADALLGQELQLPGVRTWWCGDPESRAFVLSHLDQVVCKPISRLSPRRSHFGSTMSARQLDELRRQILAEPRRWVAQEPLTMSTSPTMTPSGVRPRSTLLRTYAVSREGSYVVMPGGLTRVAPDAGSSLISNQIGAIAKDTWVLASEPEHQSEFWLRSGPTVTVADPLDGLSERAAENLFWVGRYAERAESAARLLRAVHDRRNSLGTTVAHAKPAVDALLAALTITTYSRPGFVGEGAEERRAAPDAELFSLTCDRTRPGSLAYAVFRLLDASEAVRDQLSIDTWQVTSTLEKQLATLSATSPSRQDVVQGTLGVVMQSLLSLHGLAGESMVRDAGWHFMEAGRRIERFQHLALLLRSTLEFERDTATDSLVLESTLVAAESIITYRRRYRSHAQVETLLDLLLADAGNPRSLRYQLDRLESAIAALPGNDGGRSVPLTPEERMVLQLLTDVRLADTALLARADDHGRRVELSAYLDDLVGRITLLAAALSERSFSHLPPQRSLTAVGGVGA